MLRDRVKPGAQVLFVGTQRECFLRQNALGLPRARHPQGQIVKVTSSTTSAGLVWADAEHRAAIVGQRDEDIMFDPANSSPRFLIGAAVAALSLVLALRRWAPGKHWLALSLAILFGPCGHLYLKGAARYIALMYAAWLVLLEATPLPPLVSSLLVTVLSALLMNVRIRNAARPPGPA